MAVVLRVYDNEAVAAPLRKQSRTV